MALPSVAIVVPNWNGARHLPDCLDALRNLDYPAELQQIVVVDNGSTDESRALIENQYPHVRLVKLAANEGFAAACNAGAEVAEADCLAFINNDMRAEPTWLRALVDAYDPDAAYVCVGGVILNWDGTQIDFVEGSVNFHGFAWQEHFRGSVDEQLIGQVGDLLFACGGSMLISRDVYLDLGGFDSAYFAYYEDVDLGWRLWLAGHKVRLAGAARVFHRHHSSAAALPKHLPSFLYERNALLTLFKNLSDDNLGRVLAPSLLLLAQKAALLSGTAERPFGATTVQIPERLEVTRAALVPLHAVLAVLDDLPQVLARREDVQRRRKRPDEEIFQLFLRPFLPWMHEERYLRASVLLSDLFGLDRLFDRQRVTRALVVSDDSERASELAEHLRSVISVTVWSGEDALEDLIAESDLVVASPTAPEAETIAATSKGLVVVDLGQLPAPPDSPLVARADALLGRPPDANPIESLEAIAREPWRWRRNGGVAVPEDLQRLLRLLREGEQPDDGGSARRSALRLLPRRVVRRVRRLVASATQ